MKLSISLNISFFSKNSYHFIRCVQIINLQSSDKHQLSSDKHKLEADSSSLLSMFCSRHTINAEVPQILAPILFLLNINDLMASNPIHSTLHASFSNSKIYLPILGWPTMNINKCLFRGHQWSSLESFNLAGVIFAHN